MTHDYRNGIVVTCRTDNFIQEFLLNDFSERTRSIFSDCLFSCHLDQGYESNKHFPRIL